MSASTFESLTGDVDLEFPEYDAPPAQPIPLLLDWLSDAAQRGVREPRALALATADSRGRASNRIVAIIEVSLRGVVFASHTTSRKGRELAETRWASGLLYWRETGQQVIIAGPVEPLPQAESDALWFGRPVPLHAMSAASRQSEPIDDPVTLRTEARRLAAIGGPLPRPGRFGGFRLEPQEVEFWCASSDRLHRRLRYDRTDQGWRTSRLQP